MLWLTLRVLSQPKCANVAIDGILRVAEYDLDILYHWHTLARHLPHTMDRVRLQAKLKETLHLHGRQIPTSFTVEIEHPSFRKDVLKWFGGQLLQIRPSQPYFADYLRRSVSFVPASSSTWKTTSFNAPSSYRKVHLQELASITLKEIEFSRSAAHLHRVPFLL